VPRHVSEKEGNGVGLIEKETTPPKATAPTPVPSAREIAPHTAERHQKPDETVASYIDQQRAICWNPEQNALRAC